MPARRPFDAPPPLAWRDTRETEDAEADREAAAWSPSRKRMTALSALLGAVALAFAVWLGWLHMNFLPARAQVVNVRTVLHLGPDRHSSYEAVIRYEAAGHAPIVVHSPYGALCLDLHRGEEVAILYDPARPDLFYFNTFLPTRGVFLGLAGLSGLAFLVARVS